MVSFDVDCGELISGHRFIAQGLVDEGWSTDDLSSDDQSRHQEFQMVSLAYQLVPGVTAAEAAAGADSEFVVDATYETDVDLPWTTGAAGFGPGSIEEYAGGASTGGASGPWPLPGSATRLRFRCTRRVRGRRALRTGLRAPWKWTCLAALRDGTRRDETRRDQSGRPGD
jgi:hypothetical protein